ncbi:hypothetical protein GCM10007392_30660 [Saccharospirillum salsuginis]|uniref:Uncharacterized protein n=1 Tax=Saccharospirillum salsuginis TaxID=418750 RepID=A0A918NCP2_9GAMM|nr:hypothetical protein GCM10007392_30660 [Saccharospirillum salsuginis]
MRDRQWTRAKTIAQGTALLQSANNRETQAVPPKRERLLSPLGAKTPFPYTLAL